MNLFRHMNNFSLFIISKNSEIRHFLLTMVTTPEDIVVSYKADLYPDKYGISDMKMSRRYGTIRLVDGKVVCDKNYKIYLRIFEYFIISCILISCIILSTQTPIDNPDTPISTVLTIIDLLLTFIFLIEAILKILAFGWFWNHYNGIKPYTMNAWNLLDFSVLVLSLADFILTIQSDSDSANLNSFKALRAIRTLRPLRVVSRSENLKTLIQALFSSIPAMGNVLITCLLFLLIFAILWVEFFRGQYYSWVTPLTDLLSQVNDYRDWYNVGGVWNKQYQSFNNVLIACVVLFEMMTTEGWIDVMSNGIGAAGIEKQPKYNNNEYFAIFMILGWFLLINLFTAVITDHINNIKQSKRVWESIWANHYQNQYVTIQNIAIKTKPIKRTKPPKSKFRRQVYKIVQAAWFDLLIMVVIGLNTAVIAMAYHRMSDSYALFIEVMNYIFVFLYNVEFVLKIIGLGKQYFTYDSWDLFDFVCICLSNFAILLIIIRIGGPIKNIVIFLRAFSLSGF